MEYDVIIVGAGPSGLATGIRLHQLAQEKGQSLKIAILEKATTLGAHTLSGAVIEPGPFEKLFGKDWKEKGLPLSTPVKEDHFWLLGESWKCPLPLPAALNNHGNYVGSLSQIVKWMGEYAMAQGIDLFPGFPVKDLIYNEDKTKVLGIRTQEMGRLKDGTPSPQFQESMEIPAKRVVLAEGCRGHITQQTIQHFNLEGDCPQTYALGLKEVWEIDAKHHHPGKVVHTLGWPLPSDVYGGGFLYHWGERYVSVGLIVGLDYKDPQLSPYEHFQRYKTHPHIAPELEGARRLSYGARTLVEGGLQSLPKLEFPGGLIVGDAAGFLNVAKLKGTHNALRSGMLAAEALWEDLAPGEKKTFSYTQRFQSSEIYQELHQARNFRPNFQQGLWCGLALNAVEALLKGHTPWTRHHKQADHEKTQPLSKGKPQPSSYKPDGKLTFDLLSSVHLSNTNHREDQPCHLQLHQAEKAIEVNYKIYGSPERYYCPAGVYEIVEEDGKPRLQINAPNCLHCKACDIKDPTQNIHWTTPEGDGGPVYEKM